MRRPKGKLTRGRKESFAIILCVLALNPTKVVPLTANKEFTALVHKTRQPNNCHDESHETH